MKWFFVISALAGLTACGVDGEPIAPRTSTNVNVGVGHGGIGVGTNVVTTIGNVRIGVGKVF